METQSGAAAYKSDVVQISHCFCLVDVCHPVCGLSRMSRAMITSRRNDVSHVFNPVTCGHCSKSNSSISFLSGAEPSGDLPSERFTLQCLPIKTNPFQSHRLAKGYSPFFDNRFPLAHANAGLKLFVHATGTVSSL